MPNQRALLLDSASLYFRAFFGVPEVIGPSGVPTNAVRGFLDMIASLVERGRPTHLVACWDNDWRPAFRVEAIPSYKAHRVAEAGDEALNGETVPDALSVQVPIIIDALAALGIARVGIDGHEADDVIGTLATTFRGRMPVDVVTGDRDLFQLVDDANAIRVLYTARGGVRSPDLVDEAFIAEKYGVGTGAAYADMAVLRGDTSDGLPGVAGIGEKTAAKLITTYGTLASLREAIDSGDPAIKGAQRARLEAATAYLDVARRVVDVVRDAPVPEVDLAAPVAVADPTLMSRLAIEHGLTSSFDRVVTALADRLRPERTAPVSAPRPSVGGMTSTDTPWEPPLAGTETEQVVGALDRLRATFRWKADGLDSAGLDTSIGASTLTLGGLLKHLAAAEDHHFTRKLTRRPLGRAVGGVGVGRQQRLGVHLRRR